MDKQLYKSLSFQEQLDFNTEVSKYLDKCFEKVKRDWLKDGNFTNRTIILKANGNFFYGIEGNKKEPKRGDKKFAEYEITGRWKAAKNFYMRNQNYFRDDFSIVFKPLSCSYDFDINASGCSFKVETKDRKYKSDFFKDGIMIEKMKVSESFIDGTWDDLIYTSTFTDNKMWSWKLSELPNQTWVVRDMYCPDSTVSKKKDKIKPVYLLPPEYRRMDLDVNISY